MTFSFFMTRIVTSQIAAGCVFAALRYSGLV
jgi:hypothetical protein